MFSFPSFAAILGLYIFIIRVYQLPTELTICISGIIRNFGEMQKAESGDFNTRASVVVNAVVSAHCPFGPSLAFIFHVEGSSHPNSISKDRRPATAPAPAKNSLEALPTGFFHPKGRHV